MSQDRIPGEKRIAKRYSAFRKDIMSTWESFSFFQFILDNISIQIKKGEFPNFQLEHLSNIKTGNDYKRKFDKKDTLGIVSHLSVRINPTRALLEPVAYTENYLQDLCEIVYKDFPQRLLGKDIDKDNSESEKQRAKLMSVIIKATDREEILEKIIEEKIRGIFYGNPLEFYIKDKANIGIGDYFKQNHIITQKKIAEIIARRNIYTHNEGRVDSKYLREVELPQFRLNEKVKIDSLYIRESIIILRGLAATVTKLVIENAYSKTCTSTLINQNAYSFAMNYK
ncbi:MAG: hypothetical protein U0V74_16880 [Chitinophagales bacterium]